MPAVPGKTYDYGFTNYFFQNIFRLNVRSKYIKNKPSPSPIPSITLNPISACIDLAKNGVMNVDRDHMNTAKVKIFFPP